MDNKDFSKREWFLVLILISIIQGAIWYISFVNSGNANALTYVSFAGTLISIILAVLAIGYTYGESLGQKNKSDNVSAQIAVLNEVVKSIKFESQSLEHISTISEELTRFSSTFENEMTGTKRSVEKVSKSIESFLTDYDKYDDGGVAESSGSLDKGELSQAFIRARNPLMDITTLFILVSRDKTYPSSHEMIQENVSKYIDRAGDHLTDEERKEYVWGDIEELFTGAYISLTSVLKGLGLIEGDEDNKITVSKELLREVSNSTLQNPRSSGIFY